MKRILYHLILATVVIVLISYTNACIGQYYFRPKLEFTGGYITSFPLNSNSNKADNYNYLPLNFYNTLMLRIGYQPKEHHSYGIGIERTTADGFFSPEVYSAGYEQFSMKLNKSNNRAYNMYGIRKITNPYLYFNYMPFTSRSKSALILTSGIGFAHYKYTEYAGDNIDLEFQKLISSNSNASFYKQYKTGNGISSRVGIEYFYRFKALSLGIGIAFNSVPFKSINEFNQMNTFESSTKEWGEPLILTRNQKKIFQKNLSDPFNISLLQIYVPVKF